MRYKCQSCRKRLALPSMLSRLLSRLLLYSPVIKTSCQDSGRELRKDPLKCCPVRVWMSTIFMAAWTPHEPSQSQETAAVWVVPDFEVSKKTYGVYSIYISCFRLVAVYLHASPRGKSTKNLLRKLGICSTVCGRNLHSCPSPSIHISIKSNEQLADISFAYLAAVWK